MANGAALFCAWLVQREDREALRDYEKQGWATPQAVDIASYLARLPGAHSVSRRMRPMKTTEHPPTLDSGSDGPMSLAPLEVINGQLGRFITPEPAREQD